MSDDKNLIFTKIQVRAVNLPLNSPIIAHIGTYNKWPYICIDVYTKSGIIGKNIIEDLRIISINIDKDSFALLISVLIKFQGAKLSQ